MLFNPVNGKCESNSKVKEQYEHLPYPYRDPENEKNQLIQRFMDSLAKIGHYCFKGRKNFENSFRVLVAGAGTGDSTIYLAEQLRNTNARIIHLDISNASIEVAKKRAEIRGLSNIEWICDSLNNLPMLGLGKFDYINCSGVLHHLADPDEGMNILKNSLKEDGAIGIMIYGKYGRTGIYQMQELMKLVNTNESDMDTKLRNTKILLGCLPPTNWFKRGEDLCQLITKGDETEIYDALLHSQDRAYTVSEVYDFLYDCGLHLVDFTETRERYMPETFIKDENLLGKIRELPIRKQQAIAELLSGRITQHVFYASYQQDTIAKITDIDNTPFFYRIISGERLYEASKDKTFGAVMNIQYPGGTAKLVLGEYTKYLFKYLDGKNSVEMILTLVTNDKELQNRAPSKDVIFQELKRLYETFNLMDVMVLRHKSVSL